jgi:hypothetical protein
MIYKSVSSKQIIAKVITDLRLREEDHRISDMTEWVGEALDTIGAIRQYNIKVTGKEGEPLLTISNYQAKLPDNIIKPIFIQYSNRVDGPFVPIKWNTNPISFRGEETAVNSTTNLMGTNDVTYFTMDLMGITFEEAMTLLAEDPAFAARVNAIMISDNILISRVVDANFFSTSLKYTINNNYIKMNVPDGYIRMVYTSIPVDEDNYPLVPDDSSFRDAIYWYIVTKLYYPDWVNGTIRDRVYEHAESKWRFFAKQAYAVALMPDLGQLESMKDQWNKLFPELYEFDANFSQLSERQILRNR